MSNKWSDYSSQTASNLSATLGCFHEEKFGWGRFFVILAVENWVVTNCSLSIGTQDFEKISSIGSYKALGQVWCWNSLGKMS